MPRFSVNDRVRVKFGVDRGHYGTIRSSGGDDGTYYGVKLDCHDSEMGYSEYELELSLSEHYQRQDNCEKCGGTGWIEPESGDASLDIPYRCDHRTSVEILDGL